MGSSIESGSAAGGAEPPGVVAGVGSGGDVVSALGLLVSVELSSCGHAELDVVAGLAQRVRGWVAAFDARLARRREELSTVASPPVGLGDAAAVTPGASAGDVVGPTTVDGERLDLVGAGVAGTGGGPAVRDRRPGREAEQARSRAGVLSVVPLFEGALAAGRIDIAHVDAVVAVWRGLDEVERVEFAGHAEVLVGCAQEESPERFRRRCRDLARRVARDHGVRVLERQRAAASVRRWVDRATGMSHLHAELDPETAARVWAAIDARLAVVCDRDRTAGVSLQRLEVEALTELIVASAAVDARVPEISVLVDHQTLLSGVFAVGGICETSSGEALPPDVVRRLACEANLLPVVLGGDGVPLDVGRSRRLATPGQRRALAAMYASCSMPGCEVRFDRCRIHHLDPWRPVGVTDQANLTPLCDRHHHQVHEGGWTMTMTADRVVTLRRPDGTVAFSGDTRDRVPAADLPIVLAAVAADPDRDLTVDCPTLADIEHQHTLARRRARTLARCHTAPPHHNHTPTAAAITPRGP